MIRVAACANPDGNVLREEYFKEDLYIFTCGYQNFQTKDYHINRPAGRPDYQILYIHKGCGTFLIDGNEVTCGAGSIILYRPNQPQIYSYYADDRPEVYWIHFLGTKSDQLLEYFTINTGYVGHSRNLKQLFDEIILELQLRKPMFQEICVATFLKLLATTQRLIIGSAKDVSTHPDIDRLLTHLNKHYMESWSIEMMADFCHMSVDYFSHQFKHIVGTPPLRFLNQLRIDHAKEILLTENLTISEVSKLVGFSNPLYFSRIFKKTTGISPKMYTITQL